MFPGSAGESSELSSDSDLDDLDLELGDLGSDELSSTDTDGSGLEDPETTFEVVLRDETTSAGSDELDYEVGPELTPEVEPSLEI
jgi:hypothetical protein